MDQPKISVFMPVYNGSKYLKQALDAVLNQRFTNFELLVVDDSSTDDSWLILQEYAAADKRMRLLQKARGGNVPKSWNFVRPLLRGAFVFYLSQDDLLSPDCFEQMLQRQKECGADCVLPDMLRFDDDPATTNADSTPINKDLALIGLDGDRTVLLSGREAFLYSLDWRIHGFMLCRKRFYADEVFDEESFNSDEYVTRKIFLQSRLVAFSQGRFYYRRGNAGSITDPDQPLRYQVMRTDRRLLQLMQDYHFEQEQVDAFRRRIFDSACGLYRHYLSTKNKYTPAERIQICGLFELEHKLFSKEKQAYKPAFKVYPKMKRMFRQQMLKDYILFKLLNRLYVSLHRLSN